MAGALITIEANTAEIDRALSQLMDFGENPFEFFDFVGLELVASTQDRFDTGVDPQGKAWKVSQRVEREGGKTLKKSGLLAQEITYNATDELLEVGSDKIYAAIHQFGGETGSRKGRFDMPARPFLGLSDEDEAMIVDTAFGFIEQAAAGYA